MSERQVREFSVSSWQLLQFAGPPFDGFIIITAVVCMGPDGSSVYTNGIRISPRLDRRVERPAPLTQHLLLVSWPYANPLEFTSDTTNPQQTRQLSAEEVEDSGNYKRPKTYNKHSSAAQQVLHRNSSHLLCLFGFKADEFHSKALHSLPSAGSRCI